MDGGGETDREREISMPKLVLFIRTTPMNKTVPGASPRQDPVAGQEHGGAEGQAEKQDLCLP